MPDIKEKLVELLHGFGTIDGCIILSPSGCNDCPYRYEENCDSKALADHLIANGVTIQKWISVEEALPEYGKEVLVCDTREDSVSMAELHKGFDFEGVKDPDYWIWSDDEPLNLNEFTHWMPLPEPPKGE